MFALVSCPRCLNRHESLLVKGVGTIAAPGPVFGFLDEAALHGIAVDVFEFLYSLRCAEDIEIVVTRLPEMAVVSNQLLRDRLFESLQSCGQI